MEFDDLFGLAARDIDERTGVICLKKTEANHRWSVVITTRNRAAMLRRAIASCFAQSVSCEVVVVDEASTDATAQIVKEFPQVTYIRNPAALGHSASANIGIRACSAEWIKPLDDDDWLASGCLEAMSAAVIKARSAGLNPTIITGNAINVDVDAREIGRTPILSGMPTGLRSRELLGMMMIDQVPIGTPIQVGHSREAAMRVGGWNEQRAFQHQHGDEVELWIKLSAEGDGVFIPDFVGYRTIWAGGSQTAIPHEERYRSNVFLKEKIAEELGIATPRGVREYLALHWALVAVKDRSYGQAADLALQWMRRPQSIRTLLNRRTNRDAAKVLLPI